MTPNRLPLLHTNTPSIKQLNTAGINRYTTLLVAVFNILRHALGLNSAGLVVETKNAHYKSTHVSLGKVL